MISKIIICSSSAGAGKDTVGDYLCNNYGFKKLSFANKIYEIAEDLYGMKEKNRDLLIRIGEAMRTVDPLVWINHTFKKAKKLLSMNIPVVISDLRKRIEYDRAIKEDFYPIRIVCDRNLAIERLIKRDGFCDEKLLDHQVEIETRNIHMREFYNNSTFQDLYKQIDKFMREG